MKQLINDIIEFKSKKFNELDFLNFIFEINKKYLFISRLSQSKKVDKLIENYNEVFEDTIKVDKDVTLFNVINSIEDLIKNSILFYSTEKEMESYISDICIILDRDNVDTYYDSKKIEELLISGEKKNVLDYFDSVLSIFSQRTTLNIKNKVKQILVDEFKLSSISMKKVSSMHEENKYVCTCIVDYGIKEKIYHRYQRNSKTIVLTFEKIEDIFSKFYFEKPRIEFYWNDYTISKLKRNEALVDIFPKRIKDSTSGVRFAFSLTESDIISFVLNHLNKK
jgi:hypothetical protein